MCTKVKSEFICGLMLQAMEYLAKKENNVMGFIVAEFPNKVYRVLAKIGFVDYNNDTQKWETNKLGKQWIQQQWPEDNYYIEYDF